MSEPQNPFAAAEPDEDPAPSHEPPPPPPPAQATEGTGHLERTLEKTLVLEPTGDRDPVGRDPVDRDKQGLPLIALPFLIFNGAKGILPVLLFLLWRNRGEPDFFVTALATLFLVPAMIGAVVRFFTFSYRLDEEDMVIREGLLTRQERNVPYGRIQNVDLVQSLVHRMLKVAVVRLETASGGKPEAVIHVLPLSAVDDMRRAISAGKTRKAESNRPASAAETETVPDPKSGSEVDAPAGKRLLHMGLLRLALLGLLSNRGLLVVAALFGLIQQVDFFNGSGFMDFDRYVPNIERFQDPDRFEEELTRLAEEVAGEPVTSEGTSTAEGGQEDGDGEGDGDPEVDGELQAGEAEDSPSAPQNEERSSEGADEKEAPDEDEEKDNSIEGRLWDWLFGHVSEVSEASWSPLRLVGTLVVGLVLLVVVTRLLSALWMIVTLFGFELRRDDEDLRTEYGLWTKITATVPRKRIQLLSIRETFLQRRLKVASVQIETAGGGQAENETQQGPGASRLWLAPLVDRSGLEPLVAEVMPQLSFDDGNPDLAGLDWHPLAPGARRRIMRRNILLVMLLAAILAATFGPWALGTIVLIPWVYQHAKLFTERSGWAVTPNVMLYRSGAWSLRTAAVPMSKIQGLRIAQNPFDRRHKMASLSLDTAGAALARHRIAMRYLNVDEVHRLVDHLERKTAALEFNW